MEPDLSKRLQSEATNHMASMAVNELGPMLTATEVADMLHLHVNTVKRLGDRGELPFYRVCKRGDRRFPLQGGMAVLARKPQLGSLRPPSTNPAPPPSGGFGGGPPPGGRSPGGGGGPPRPPPPVG